MSDEAFMRAALDQALLAGQSGEVPIGAIVVVDGAVVGAGHNRTLADCDPSAHAEIVALRQAARAMGNHRLVGATLVATLEPCLMCCGAAIQSRVERVVFAVEDPKAGACGLLQSEMDRGRVNHRLAIERGPFGAESAELLRAFFRARR